MPQLYSSWVLSRPVFSIVFIVALLAVATVFAQNFRLDASADSIVLEEDEDLRYSRKISERYQSADFVLITYAPKLDIFSPEVLATLDRLKEELEALARVSSVVSILDVPLLNSPTIPLADLTSDIPTLRSESTQLELAKKELTQSPLYRELIISKDGKITALQVNFVVDQPYIDMQNERNQLRREAKLEVLTVGQQQRLAQVSAAFELAKARFAQQRDSDINAIRKIMLPYKNDAEMFLGGVPMITADMINFVKDDLRVFSIGVMSFLVFSLAIIFRRIRWVVLPMLACTAVVVLMLGLLGLLDWPATVISANFVALLLIITLSMNIHLIVRYRELAAQDPQRDLYALVQQTCLDMARPCFYSALTTAVAFSSLIVSGIRPVIDFGLMMSMGIAIAYIISFTFFPTMLLLLKPLHEETVTSQDSPYTVILATITQRHGKSLLMGSLVVAAFSVAGMSLLKVENRFIDYFKKDTEIYQGMSLVDEYLGGTTPLEVIIEKGEEEQYVVENDDFDDDFADDFEDDSAKLGYWFNAKRLAELGKVHEFLDQLPASGKVQSVHTTMVLAQSLNEGKALTDLEIALVKNLLPEAVASQILTPYISEEFEEARFVMRVRESDPSLRRGELLQNIRDFLINDMGYAPERVHLTGMVVLYNNMLQSLFQSQILTLGAVFAGILLMFLVLFRSFGLALLALTPSMLTAALILGLMGLLNIPLDLMTITIAAISVGIGVDHAIHYIVRYRKEFAINGDYAQSMFNSHRSIGRAIYYTSLTIVIGFSILAFSNFVPSLYFGLFTGLAMVLALLATLTLLPQLMMTLKPLGQPAQEPA